MRALSSTASFAAAATLLVFAACSSEEPAGPGSTPSPEAGAPDAPSGGDASADGGTTKPGEARRGSRLAPRFRQSADGFEEFSAIVDTQLANATCYASRASDGVVRCLPNESVYVTGDLYADDGCKTRVAGLKASCAKPAFATVSLTVGQCETNNAIHEVGAVHSGALYHREAGVSCVSATATAGQTYYVVGAERPASSFVKMTEGTEEIAGGVGVRFVDGEDGSHFPEMQLVAVARAEPCNISKAADGKDRCLPNTAGTVYGYLDSACMTLAGHTQETCHPFYTPKSLSYNDPALAGGGTRVFEIGAKQATNEIYNKVDATTCNGPANTTDEIHALGAEIPPASYPETVRKTEGGTRLVSTRAGAGGASIATFGGIKDLMLDASCSVTKATDGKMRCIPQGYSVEYSDDQCTQRHVVVFGSPQEFPKYAVETDKGCPEVFKLFPVGAEITPLPAMTYENHTGSCVGQPLGGQVKAYALGAEVPPSTFVEVTEVIR